MGKSLFCLALAMLVSVPAAMKADVIDPQGVFDDLVEGIPILDVDAFNFSANENGGGVFNFRNVSGDNWIAFDFLVTLPQNSLVFCGPGPFFLVCSPIPGTPSNGLVQYDIRFQNPRTTGGILNNMVFAFNLNDSLPDGGQNFDPNVVGGWGAENGFHVEPTAATTRTSDSPEPSSWALFATGICLVSAIFTRRRRVSSGQSLQC